MAELDDKIFRFISTIKFHDFPGLETEIPNFHVFLGRVLGFPWPERTLCMRSIFHLYLLKRSVEFASRLPCLKQKWLPCRLWLALKGARRRSLFAIVARQDSEIIYFSTNRAQSASVRSSHLKAVLFTKMCDIFCLLSMEALNFCENKCWNMITEDLKPLSSRSNLRAKVCFF